MLLHQLAFGLGILIGAGAWWILPVVFLVVWLASRLIKSRPQALPGALFLLSLTLTATGVKLFYEYADGLRMGVEETMREEGLDTRNPSDMMRVFEDPDLFAKAKASSYPEKKLLALLPLVAGGIALGFYILAKGRGIKVIAVLAGVVTVIWATGVGTGF